MSLNGLSFTRDDFLLEPGMTLLLAIPIEDSRDEIRLPGKVVWVKVGDDRQVQVDVAFEELTGAHKDRLIEKLRAPR